ncbi:MAG: ABC transporter substrate-binding protein [Chloroflexi bacterium]|nr:ABC transporter substrate-binding protein [Chloroflexota bacterium]
MKQKLLYVVIIAALVLSACGGGGAKQPAIVRIGWSNGPDSLNPGIAWLEEAYTIYELVYDSMYDLNLDGTFKLSLADSVSASADGTVYTYKIKKGIKWHDGQPFTAKDIAFSYTLYKDHTDFPTLNSYTEHFVSSEAPDDTTLVLTLDQSIPNIESRLIFLYILPEHIWKDHTGKPSEASEDSSLPTPTPEPNQSAEFENIEMIGTGPFKMKEYQPNEFIDLAVNTEYYGGRAKVDEVIFQVFSSPDVLVQAIKTGQVDMITELPNTSVESLKTAENVKVAVGAPFAPNLADIIINQVAPENCPSEADGGVCSGHPALMDKQVRLALAYATDKKKLIDVVLVGYGTPGIALIPDGMGEWFNSSIKDFEFDVAKANKVLDDAGYKDANGDGIRDMPDGSKPLTFRMNWPTSSIVGPRMAELLGDMWKQIGITLEPQAVEDDALTAKCCPALDYDIIIWGWVADPDPATLLIIPATDQIVTGYNETGFSSPRYDELYVQQGTELDHAKRVQMVWEMQQIVHDEVVYIIPFYYQQVQAYRTDRFKGWLDSEIKLALEDPTSIMVIEPVK